MNRKGAELVPTMLIVVVLLLVLLFILLVIAGKIPGFIAKAEQCGFGGFKGECKAACEEGETQGFGECKEKDGQAQLCCVKLKEETK